MSLSAKSYYRGFDWLIQGGVLLILIVAPLEGRGRSLYQVGQGMALVGLLGRCGMDFSWRYLWRVVAAFVLAVAALMAAPLVFALSGPSWDILTFAAEAFFKQYALILLATVILLCHEESDAFQRIRAHPRIMAIVVAMIVFWFLTVMASTVSLDQNESLRTVRKDMGPYFLFFLLAIETVRTWARFRRLVVLTFVVGALTCLASVLAYFLYMYADHFNVTWLKLWMISDDQRGWVRVATVRDIEVQAQFPFSHPNRLGSFGVLITMMSLLVGSFSQSWKVRAWVVAGGLVALVAVFLSVTRGAMIAAVLGLVLFAILWNWRFLIVLAIALPLGYFVAPQPVQKRVEKIFNPREYNLRQGNIARRVHVGLAAVEMIRDYPWFGIGYGTEVFEMVYPRYKERVIRKYELTGPRIDPEPKSHAHNNFLQIAAGRGLPALAAFLVFIVLLALGLLRRRQRPPNVSQEFVLGFRSQASALLALWFAALAYGMSNYSLRLGIGMYIWLLLGMSVAFVQLSAEPPAPLERPRK